MTARWFLLFCSVLTLWVPELAFTAQKDKKTEASGQRETVAKPMSERERRRREERLRRELETPYRKWLSDDVSYIITDEERAAFKRLSTDE